jgi:hypothetical protein
MKMKMTRINYITYLFSLKPKSKILKRKQKWSASELFLFFFLWSVIEEKVFKCLSSIRFVLVLFWFYVCVGSFLLEIGFMSRKEMKKAYIKCTTTACNVVGPNMVLNVMSAKKWFWMVSYSLLAVLLLLCLLTKMSPLYHPPLTFLWHKSNVKSCVQTAHKSLYIITILPWFT